MPGTGRRRAAAAAACGVGPAQGPALSQAEVPALSSGPRELARPGTRVLRPACQKAEGAVGLCTGRRATHMEPLSNPEKGVPSSLQGQPASAGAGQPTLRQWPRRMGQCLAGRGSGRDGEGHQGWPGVGLDCVHLPLPASLTRLYAAWRHAPLHLVSAWDAADAKYTPAK